MARLTVGMADGWPVMEPLRKKEAELLHRNLAKGERVLGQVVASFHQVVVATDQKVLIVKTGMMAGQTFGGKATSYDYRNVVGVEVRTGFTQGEFELLAGGLANNQGNRVKDKIKMSEAPNGVVFAKASRKYFDAMATKIRERAASGPQHLRTPPPAPAPPAHEEIAQAIEKLGDLRASGLLTDEEFTAKKAELLARL